MTLPPLTAVLDADDRDAWMDEITDESGAVLRITEEPWLDWVFGKEPHAPEVVPRIAPIGALALWNDELRRGLRTKDTIDALSRAACREALGFDARREGLESVAHRYFGQAAAIIVDATAERAA